MTDLADLIGIGIVLTLLVGSSAFAYYMEKTQQDQWTCECTQTKPSGSEAVCTERVCKRAEDAKE